MSTSPLPPDPYEALGVDRDCDVDAVKKAHRKLVLKHHPDRIKDPALVEHNQNEFTKVQQAYELLADPTRRRRYDDECRLAQLRRERMSEARTTYTKTTYAARPTPAPTHPVQREAKSESRYDYEERMPDSPYVDFAPRGFDDLPRGGSRKVDSKVDPTEKRASVSKTSDRKGKAAGAWEREKEKTPMSLKTAFGMAAMATNMAQAQKARNKEREKVDKEKEKESYARQAKQRDKEERSARDIKNTYTRQTSATVEDYSDDSEESSGSESDTVVTQGRPTRTSHLTAEVPRPRRSQSPMSEVRTTRQQSSRPVQRPGATPKSNRQPSPRPEVRSNRQLSPRPEARSARQPSPRPDARSARQPSPRPEARQFRQPSPRPDQRDQRSFYDDDSQDDDKHTHAYRTAQDYITIAQRKDPRPPLSRQGSGVHEQYWQTEPGKDRKSGSDSDKQRPSSSHKVPRRSMPDESKLRPQLFAQSSAPAGTRSMAGVERGDYFATGTRSRGDSYLSNNHRREMPELKRSPSEPVPKLPGKRDSVPLKGSSLKQAESLLNPDSGYGSSPNPQTPEAKGESPHRESRESRENRDTRDRDSRPREASSTTKYSVKKEDDGPRLRKMAAEDGAPMSRFLSPEDQPRHHHHHHNPESRDRHGSRSRERESEGRHRSSSGRPAPPERQSSFHRNDTSSRYEDRDRSRSIRNERSPDRHNHNRSVPDDAYVRPWQGNVRESRARPALYQNHTTANFTKPYAEASQRSMHPQRRPSTYV